MVPVTHDAVGHWLTEHEGALMRQHAHGEALVRAGGVCGSDGSVGREACGLVLQIQGRWMYAPTDNVAIAADEYMVDPERHRQLISAGVQVVGVFHSHVNAGARASELDLAMAQDGLWYVIYSVRDQEFNWWLEGG